MAIPFLMGVLGQQGAGGAPSVDVYFRENFKLTTTGNIGTDNSEINEIGNASIGASGGTGVWPYRSDGSGLECTAAGTTNARSWQTDGREDVQCIWDIVLDRGSADTNWQAGVIRHTGGGHHSATMRVQFEGPATGADDLVLYDSTTAIHTWDISTTSPEPGDKVRLIVNCDGDDIVLVSIQKNSDPVDTYNETYTLTGAAQTNHGAGSGADWYGIRSTDGVTSGDERFEFFEVTSIP